MKKKKPKHEYADRILTFQVSKEDIQKTNGMNSLLENRARGIIDKNFYYEKTTYHFGSVSICPLTEETLLVTVLVWFRKNWEEDRNRYTFYTD